MTTDLPHQTLIDRFEEIARLQLSAVQEAYAGLDAVPEEVGDKALAQRHATCKALLSHIALLQKMLGFGPSAAAATAARGPGIAELEAMLADVREARDD